MTLIRLRNKRLLILLIPLLILVSSETLAQVSSEWELEKFPVDLETDFALSALPSHLRKDATVYLLDPKKGFYLAHKGSNGFMCFVARTEWEWGVFRKDIATPVSYDVAGTVAIFSVYQDVESMRARENLQHCKLKTP
jgi:hypothetical protein